MKPEYLIDTNAAIDYLDNKLPLKWNIVMDTCTFQISVITRIELLGWQNATFEQLSVLQNFVIVSKVFNLEENIIIKAIELRKTYKIKLPDAIIAATALVYRLILITRNVADFKNIVELKIIDPYS